MLKTKRNRFQLGENIFNFSRLLERTLHSLEESVENRDRIKRKILSSVQMSKFSERAARRTYAAVCQVAQEKMDKNEDLQKRIRELEIEEEKLDEIIRGSAI